MRRKGFSLASLLLLTAVVAVFLAATSVLWLSLSSGQTAPRLSRDFDVNPTLIAVCAIGGLLIGTLVGFILGIGRLPRLKGVFVGTAAGVIAGAASGLLLAAPQKILPILAGSLVIVAFSLVVRQFSARSPK